MFWTKIGILLLYILCLKITHSSGIARNRDIVRLARIYNAKIWSKLLNRSALVGELENNELKNIFTPDFKINEHNLDRTADALYLSFKCHCADSIRYLHRTGYASLEKPSVYNRNIIVYDTIVTPTLYFEEVTHSFLNTLNRNLKLTITILFEMSDSVRSLKINEPYFLKVLISTHMYINKLIQHKFHGFDKNRKIKLLVDGIGEDKHLTEPRTIQRMILQVVNLVERFTIENCTTNEVYDRDGLFVDHENDLMDLLRRTRASHSDPKSSRATYDLDRVLLTACFGTGGDSRAASGVLRELCEGQLSDATAHDEHRTPVSLRRMFVETRSAYGVRALHGYLGSVYKTLKKIVYLKFKDSVGRKKSEDLSLDAETMRQLSAASCPVELIADLKLLTTLAHSSRTDVVGELTDAKLASLSDVRLPSTDGASLKRLVECIVGAEFEQFWWVFNLLQYESEKQSNHVYGVSLEPISNAVLHPGQYARDVLYPLDYKCNALETIYHNIFRSEVMINYYRDTPIFQNFHSTREIFLKIRENNLFFSNHLSHVIKTFSSVDYLSYKDDFLKILMAMISNLENAHYTEIDCKTCKNEEQLKNFFTNNTAELFKVGDYVINLLDHYQIRKCRVIKTRAAIYSEFLSNSVLNVDFYDSIFYLPIPIGVSKNSAENDDDRYVLSRSTSKEELANTTGKDIKIHVPLKFHTLDCLNGAEIPSRNHVLHDFRPLIYFNCHGNVRNVYEHQIRLGKNVLSMRYFVEFEKIVFKWILSSFYIAWINVFEDYTSALNSKRIDQHGYDLALEKMHFYLGEIIFIEFPEFCNVYLNAIKIVYTYYDVVSDADSAVAYNTLVVVMEDALDRLEVFYVQQTSTNVTDMIKHHDDDPCTVLHALTDEIKDRIATLKENLIFVD